MFTIFSGFSQNNVIFNESAGKSYIFKYQSDNKYPANNYIIEKTAELTEQNTNSLYLNFSYTQNLKITKKDNNTLEISLEFSDKKCSQNLNYRNISISRLFIPSRACIKLNLYKNDIPVKPIELNDISTGNTAASTVTIDDTQNTSNDSDSYKLNTETIVFYYDEADKGKFDNTISLIEDYYIADNFIELSQQKLIEIDLDKVKKLLVYEMTIKDIEKNIESLRKKNFEQNLNLAENDPVNFVKRFNDISQTAKKLRLIIDQYISTLDYAYYKKGIDFLGKYDTINAITHFIKSTEINPNYISAYYQLGKIYYNSDSIVKAADIVSTALNKSMPDTNTKTMLIQLSDIVYKRLISKSSTLINKQKYNEAISLLMQTSRFCESSKYILCNDDLFRNLSAAKYGIYSSYLSIAGKAVEGRELTLAKEYIDLASNYQLENSKYIPDNNKADSLLGVLVDSYLSGNYHFDNTGDYEKTLEFFYSLSDKFSPKEINCSKKISEGIKIAKNGIYNNLLSQAENLLYYNDIKKAEEYVNKAKLYQKENAKDITDTIRANIILGKTQYIRYRKLITEGEKFLQYGFPESALKSFTEAKELEKNYIFDKDPIIDSLIQSTAKPVLIDNIKKGNVKAWGNDLTAARQILQESMSFQKDNNLAQDTDVTRAIESLRNKIFEKECDNAQYEYDADINNAKKCINEKNFLQAETFFAKAIETAKNRNSCDISDTSAQAYLKKYYLPITYQKKIDETYKELNDTNYQSIADEYAEIETYYRENKIEQFLKPFTLYEFASTQEDLNFIAFCAEKYSSSEPANSLSLLKILKSKNFPGEQTKELQKKTGIALAKKDYTPNPNQTPEMNISKYTGNSTWFKCFNKAYIKAWGK